MLWPDAALNYNAHVFLFHLKGYKANTNLGVLACSLVLCYFCFLCYFFGQLLLVPALQYLIHDVMVVTKDCKETEIRIIIKESE